MPLRVISLSSIFDIFIECLRVALYCRLGRDTILKDQIASNIREKNRKNMFVIETRRNSAREINVVVSSHSNDIPSTKNEVTFVAEERNNSEGLKRSPLIADASVLDRQSLLLRAVASSRHSQSSQSSNTTTASNNYDDGITVASISRLRNTCHGNTGGESSSLTATASGGCLNMTLRGGANKYNQQISQSTELTCRSDYISPYVCKRLLSLSEDMNLLVRNITKEAKTLVHAET